MSMETNRYRGDAEAAYAATASAYDLFALPNRSTIETALETTLPSLHPEHGPILDIGAGSGANSAFLLERRDAGDIVALEPSRAMRSLLLGRIAAHPEWFSRITVRPESFFDADLPRAIGGAFALGVIGHFDAGERAAVLAELARRLPNGCGVLLDVPDPAPPHRVEPAEFTVATVGAITYRGIAEAWPEVGEAMRWRVTYLSLDGERVLTEDTVEHRYYHPTREVLRAEAAGAGFTARTLPDSSCVLCIRR